MFNYNDLYECLRKEKAAEQLQRLPEDFVNVFSDYLAQSKAKFYRLDSDETSEEVLREKKQFENALGIFKELFLRRKRKILNLVFVATETGILKRDFGDMLSFEQELFDKMVKSVNESDKALHEALGKKKVEVGKRIIIQENVEQFVDMAGKVVGPFDKGSLVNIDPLVAEILVSGGRAIFVEG